MAKVIDFYKGNDCHVRTAELPVGDNKFIGNSSKYLLRLFTRFSYCSKMIKFDYPTQKQTAYKIKMINHLDGSHMLVAESL